MDIQIVEQKQTMQVVIQCRKIDDEVLRLKTYIELFDKKLLAKKNDEQQFISSSGVLYFEAVENHTFLYTKDEVMETKLRLYELEAMLSEKDFIRISKSLIVNVNKIRSLKPELNRTVLATMCNGEQLYISRRYVQAVRKLLSI